MNTKERMIQSFLENTEGWKSILDSSPDLITILDTEFNVVWVNKAMAGNLNTSPDSCLGLKCFEAVHKTGSPLKNCPHAKMMADCHEYTEEVNEENLGGCFLVTASPIKDESGNVLGSIHIARDISGRKKAEKQKQMLMEQLQQLNEELEVSNEELQATNEELQVANEELQQQGEDMAYLNQALRESEQKVRLRLEAIVSPDVAIGDLDLADILDIPAVQSLMDNFYELASIPMAIIDLKGEVLVGVGWQDICTKFHRVHPETRRHCIESDTQLSVGIPPGEFRRYRCKNNMWDIATPIIVGGKHMGNLFSGQFFFDDEQIDYELFKEQAQKYNFDEEEYIAALRSVPRLGRKFVNESMAFFINLAEMISQMSYNNIKLARSLTERETLMDSLRESEQRMNRSQEIGHIGSWELDLVNNHLFWSDEVYRIFGLQPQEFDATYEAFLDAIHHEDREAVDAAYSGSVSEGRDAYEIEHRVVRKSTGEIRIVHEKCEHIRDESGQIIRSVGMVHDITEHKQAEDALRESEERFRDLADNIPNLAWMADADGWIFWYNKRWYDYTGTTLEEMQGWGWQKVHHPDYVDPVTEEWSTRIKEGKPYDNIFPLKSKDGSYRWFLTRVTPIRDENGKIQRWFGTNTDITERKEAEESILWNQQRNELLADVSSRLLSSENPQDIIDDICQKTMEFLDCDVFFNYLIDEQRECLHLNAYAGIPEEEAKKIEWLDYGVAVCGCAALESRRIIAENIFETPDPRTDLVKSYGVQAYACHPLMVEGMSIGTLSFGTNSRASFTDKELELMNAVTDQISIAMNRLISNRALKKSEEAAIQARNEWEHTFESVPDLIAILGTNYKIIRANKAMADRFGITPEECIGLTCYEVVHGTDEPPSFCPHRQLLEDGCEHTEEVHEDSLGGDFLVSASPLHDSEGKLIGSVHVARDITERKKKEKELYQLNKAYRALSNSSQAMISAENELEYLESVCNIVVEDCGHSMVWIGYAEEDENKSVRPMAHAGFDEGYIESLNITWADSKLGQGPTGTAIRTQKITTCKNMLTDPKFEPWRQSAIERGYASSLVLPLIFEGKSLGALSIYSTEPDSFSEDEVKLLSELADKLAYGINVIRLRIAREKAEMALREAKNNLEEQVKERTLKLEEAYESLKLANNYNRSLIEANLDPLVTIGPDGKITDVNDATETVTGYSRDELVGTDFSNYFTEPEKARTGYKQVFRDRTVLDYPLEIQHRNGYITPVLYNASVYEDESGNIIGVFAAARDITELKRAEVEKQKLLEHTQQIAEELEVSNEELQATTVELQAVNKELEFAFKYNRSLIETSLDPLVTIGPDGKVTDVNMATELVTGYHRDALVGTDFSNYFTEPEKARKGYQEVFREGQVFDYPLEIKHKDGHVTPVLYNASVYRDEQDNVIGVFAAARDITERKNAEELLKLKLDELARSNAELEQFAYVSSHDLQEPLRMIGSYLQLLQRRYHGQLDDKADKYIDFAVDGASRMQNLINDLLEFSRVTTRAREFEPTDCEFVLDQVLSNLEVSIKENEVVISHNNLPTVMADPTQLVQVFQNLISNAIKFRSEKPPKIYISAEKDGDKWIFSVADNGIGIDSKHSERIFEVFKRLHKRREYPGTGIGLSICKKIIERHGGHIWVKSEPNEGAIFYFTLPQEGVINDKANDS